jgi:transcriptional regulator GlxA family with amidase domain
MDLSLYIIERYTTPEFGAHCAKVIVIDPSRASQSPYMIFDHQKSHADGEILKA